MRLYPMVFACLLAVVWALPLAAQEAGDEAPAAASVILDEKERQIRDRYEQSLSRNPLQDQAFDKVYASYLAVEGVDAWAEKLKAAGEASPTRAADLIVLGRIADRQFKPDEAIGYLEQAKALGESRPEFFILLGTLYYGAGRDAEAIELLTGALDSIPDPEKRAQACRLLGSLLMRQGKKDEAVAAWKRLTEQNPDDLYAHLELAEIYEDNRMLDEALGVYTRIAELSENDPYQRCRALRAIGGCRAQQEKYPEAIASYEQALELVAPGNWLFEDLKLRLVTVYQDTGDLAGLATYLTEKLAQSPADTEFRDLLAETYTRMGKLDEAEAEYRSILERDPQRAGAYEDLIDLYARRQQTDKVVEIYRKLIELFPSDTDYLRRLGEVHLRAGQIDAAKATWQEVVGPEPTGRAYADLAGWYEEYDFAEDAMAAYEKALALERNREWVLRLAALKHAAGQDEVAVQLWQSLVEGEGRTAADYAEIASILETHNYFEESEPLLRKAMELEPDNLEHAMALAKNLVRQERHEEAVPVYEQLAAQTANEYFQERGESGLLDTYATLGILQEKQKEWEAQPDSPEVLLRLARFYERSGNREKTIPLYLRCIELAPDNPDYVRHLAEAYRTNNLIEEAIETYKKLVELDKNRAGGYYRELLDIYLKADMREPAIETARKIVESTPSDPEARLDLAQVLMSYQHYDEALQEYRYALRLEPDEPDYHRQYGEALMQQERLGEAQEAFRRMMETAKEDETRQAAVRSLAGIHYQQGRIDDLLREFQGRVRNTPKRLAAYEELAAIYKETGDVPRALETLEAGLENVDDKVPALQRLVRECYEMQNFEKVVSYYEQLLAASGKPTAFEYERLGKVYAQLGEVEKAREVWNRITAEDPDNPKSYATLAKVLRDEGFTEEAMAATEKALELDPYDFRLRFEYAQNLASTQQTDLAIDQLTTLLELGAKKEREDEARDEEKEKKVERRMRGQGIQSAYMFSPGYSMRVRYFGMPGFGGKVKFADLRPQVIMTLASIAENSAGIDPLIEEFKSRVEKDPNNNDARQDLLLIYEATNRLDEAAALAEELLARRPEDSELLYKAAMLYSNLQNIDKAVEIMERLAQAEPTKRKEALLGLINLYIRQQDEDKAGATADAVMAEYGDDYAVISQLMNLFMQQGKLDRVRSVYALADKVDPRYRRMMKLQMAQACQRLGALDEAVAMYREILLAEDAPSIWSRGYRTRPAVFAPPVGDSQQSGMIIYTSPAQNIQRFLPSLEYDRLEALNQLTQLTTGKPEAEEIVNTLREKAQTYASAVGVKEKEEAWKAAQMLMAHLFNKDEKDKAREIADQYRAAGLDDLNLYNLLLYFHLRDENFPEMAKVYDEMERRHPSRRRDIVKARMQLAIRAADYPRAAELIRQLFKQSVPPREIVASIRKLYEVGEEDLALALLEEHVSLAGRNSEELGLLSLAYREKHDYDKALELAKEAWQRRAHGLRSQPYYYGYGYYYYGGSQQPDSLLEQLFQAAKDAGKSAELVKEFENQLAKQPSSVQLHENLARLHQMSGNRDKAVEVYKSLIEKRPHYVPARMRLAEAHEQAGQLNEALAIYEDILKSRSGAYRSMSWQIRELYRRMGKGEELAELESDLVKKATNPDQMRDLAWRFQNDGEYDKAIELFEKVLKLRPSDTYIYSELANTLQQAGRMEEALQAYTRWVESPTLRSQGYIDYYSVERMVAFHKAFEKLEDLKARNARERAEKPHDRIAMAIEAQIAVFERRFDDALSLYRNILDAQPDPNAVRSLLQLAEFRADPTEIMSYLEGKGMLQSHWDPEQAARFYLVCGDRKKAYETWKTMAQSYGGNYGYLECLRRLIEWGMHEEAEDYYSKNRRDVTETWIAEQMDEMVARAYAAGQGFQATVERELQKEIKGPTSDLLKALLRATEGDTERSARVLKPLLDREPENEDLLWEQAKLLRAAQDWAALEPVLARLTEKDAANVQFFSERASCLYRLGREEEARALLDAWVDAKPDGARVPAAADFLKDLWLTRAILDLRDRTADKIDAADKERLEIYFARVLGDLGDFEGARQAYLSAFEKRPDASNFNNYFTFLEEAGLDREAYEFFRAHKDDGFLDQWQGGSRSVPVLCVRNGDFDTLLDVAWRFTRFGERWNREHFLNQLMEGLEGFGTTRRFLADIEAKTMALDPVPLPMVESLAQARRRVGDEEGELALYRWLLEKNPYNRAVAQRYADCLHRLHRYDEEIEYRRGMKGALSLREEVDDALALARACFQADRADEGKQVLEELMTWAPDAQTRISIGRLYVEVERYEDGLAELEGVKAQLVAYRDAMRDLGKCYAKLGRDDEALELWRQFRERNWEGWLYEERLYGLARRLAGEIIESGQGNRNTYMVLASASQKAGDTEACRKYFAEAYATASRPGRTELVNAYADLLLSEDLLADVLASDAPASDPVLAWAAAEAFAKLARGQAKKAEELREAAAKLTVTEPAALLTLGAALAALEDKAAAAAACRRAAEAPEATLEEKLRAAETLVKAEDFSSAAAIYDALLTAWPSLPAKHASAVRAFAKTGQTDKVQACLQRIAESTPYESQAALARAMADYDAGGGAPALDALAALAGAPNLARAHVETLAQTLDEAGHVDGAVAAYERRAAGGFGDGPRDEALVKLVETKAKAGDMPAALAYHARLLPSATEHPARSAAILAEHVKPEHLGPLRDAVVAAVQAEPDHDRASDLLYLYGELAERAGQASGRAELVAAAGLQGREAEEAMAWDGLIESWAVLGPYSVAQNPKFPLPVEAQVLEQGLASLDGSALPWIRTDEADTLGYVEFDRILGLEGDGRHMKAGLAMTRIVSPDEREVVFALGADDWDRIWVNGKEVHESLMGRTAYPGQMRFRAKLNAGDNCLVVKLGNGTQEWRFCLAPVENAEGLTAGLP
jgi:tetratricopeptide (TPR) repeat protein